MATLTPQAAPPSAPAGAPGAPGGPGGPAAAPLRVDTHTHILPRDWPAFQETFGYAGFIRLEHHVAGWARMMKDDAPDAPDAPEGSSTVNTGNSNSNNNKPSSSTFFREVEEDLWDMDARLAYMDQTGIDVQVACTVPVMFSYWARPEDTLQVSAGSSSSSSFSSSPLFFILVVRFSSAYFLLLLLLFASFFFTSPLLLQ